MFVFKVASAFLLFCRIIAGGSVLAFVDIEKNYDDASNFCQKFGFILARINNNQVFNEVKQITQASNPQFWIGMRLDISQLPTYTYVYETGEPAYFTAWAYDEPDAQQSDQCVRIKDGEFRTKECNKNYYFLCQKITEEPITTTASGTTSVSSLSTVHYHTTSHGDDGTTDMTFFTTVYHNTEIPANNKTLPLLGKRLEDIKNNLTVDKTSLTLNRMRLVCASDDRTSSYSIGMVGAAIIFIVIAMMIIGDLFKVLLWLKQNLC